jgi:MFS family permease
MAETTSSTPSSPVNPRSTSRIGATVGVLSLGWVFIYLDRVLIFPLLPLIGHEFGIGDTLRGLVVSSYFVCYVGMQIPAGILGDRYGLGRVLFMTYLLVGVALIGVGLLSHWYAVLLAFAALHGLGAGGYYSGSYGLTIGSVPVARRGVASAIVSVGMAMGLGLGLAIAVPMATALGSWRQPFLVLSVPTLLIAGLIYYISRNAPNEPATTRENPVQMLRVVTQNRDLMLLSVVAFFALYGYWVLITWAPSFLLEDRGFDLATAGQFTAVLAIASIPGALVWGPLSDRVGRKWISVGMLFVGSGAIAMVGLVTSSPLLLATLAVYGLVSSLAWNPVLVAWAGDLVQTRHGLGTAIGILNFFAVGSSFAGPVITGAISDLTNSIATGFYVGAAALFVAAILCIFVRDERQTEPARVLPDG